MYRSVWRCVHQTSMVIPKTGFRAKRAHTATPLSTYIKTAHQRLTRSAVSAPFVVHRNTKPLAVQVTPIVNVNDVTSALLVKRKLWRVTTCKIVCANPVPMKPSNQSPVHMNALHVGNVPTMNFKHKYATEQSIEIALTVLQMLSPKATIMA